MLRCAGIDGLLDFVGVGVMIQYPFSMYANPDEPGWPLQFMPAKTVATSNPTSLQTASFVRAASAVGWYVRAQVRSRQGLVSQELASLPNVELIEGDLTQRKHPLNTFLNRLFWNARLAFVNTTHWGDEIATGCACAGAAKRAGAVHYIYSSMPDHSVCNEN